MKMPAIVNGSAYELPDDPRRTSPAPRNEQRSFGWQSPTPEELPMSVHMSSKPADEASRLPAAAWLVLGIVLAAEVMDLLDSTITTIAALAISSSLHGRSGPAALTSRHCQQAAMRVPNVPPITWRESGAENRFGARRPQPALRRPPRV
jgi:hypothetical protein